MVVKWSIFTMRARPLHRAVAYTTAYSKDFVVLTNVRLIRLLAWFTLPLGLHLTVNHPGYAAFIMDSIHYMYNMFDQHSRQDMTGEK